MKRIILSLLSLLLVLGASAQSASTSPGTGHWVVIDSGYQVATATTGKTVAPLYFYNTSTSEKITGMQFRIKYDNTAFTEAIPSLKISSTDQYLQYVDDKTNGYLSVTVVYTGTSSTFNYSNGATFDLTFTHAADAVWNTLDSIKSLKISKVAGWNDLASTNFGNDTTLTVYSYGGRMNQKMLRFAGKFINVTGTNAKNLWVALEKKAPGGSWTQVEAKATNLNGHVVFFKNIDTTYWDVRMTVKGDTMSIGNVLSTADAQKINQAVLNQYTPTGFDFYTMDVNGGDGVITIADAYSVFGKNTVESGYVVLTNTSNSTENVDLTVRFKDSEGVLVGDDLIYESVPGNSKVRVEISAVGSSGGVFGFGYPSRCTFHNNG
jgi:hypothetical protein